MRSLAREMPLVSVVIPSRNRPRQLARCLAGLAASISPPEHFEVLVVDDGGQADLAPVIGAIAPAFDARLVRQDHAGPARARNTGAHEARASLLAFVDDDCVPHPTWLAALLATHRLWPEAAIGGRTRNGLAGNRYSEASQALIDYLYQRANSDPNDAAFFATLNLAIPRAPFLAAGGFDTSFPLAAGEDREFCRRWRARGHRMVFSAEAIVAHGHSLDLPRFLAQHYRYGRGARRLTAGTTREPAFSGLGFYTGLVTAPLRDRSMRDAPLLVALLALAQLATAAGYAREATTRHRL